LDQEKEKEEEEEEGFENYYCKFVFCF